MIITISGNAGSGKSTLADDLAKRLGMKSYDMGGIRRQMAKERGMSLEEFNVLGEKDISTDKVVDDYQKELGKKEDNFIIQGRTSFFLIPQSFKIFLKVDMDVAAERIFHDLKKAERNEGNEMQSIAAIKKLLIKREKSDRKRYPKYYGVDIDRMEQYDLVIDTTSLSKEEVLKTVLQSIAQRRNI